MQLIAVLQQTPNQLQLIAVLQQASNQLQLIPMLQQAPKPPAAGCRVAADLERDSYGYN